MVFSAAATVSLPRLTAACMSPSVPSPVPSPLLTPQHILSRRPFLAPPSMATSMAVRPSAMSTQIQATSQAPSIPLILPLSTSCRALFMVVSMVVAWAVLQRMLKVQKGRKVTFLRSLPSRPRFMVLLLSMWVSWLNRTMWAMPPLSLTRNRQEPIARITPSKRLTMALSMAPTISMARRNTMSPSTSMAHGIPLQTLLPTIRTSMAAPMPSTMCWAVATRPIIDQITMPPIPHIEPV